MTNVKRGKTFSFDVCSECRNVCCKDANPPLTNKRKVLLSEYLEQKTMSIEASLFSVEEYSHPVADQQGLCVFYDKETRKCKVHSVKPETCIAGPVTFDINLKTGKVEFYLKKAEICQFAGVLYENKALLEEHLSSAQSEILQLISDLDARDLKAILRIPEPETFKISEVDLPNEVSEMLQIGRKRI
jgi:uncharacterized protein